MCHDVPQPPSHCHSPPSSGGLFGSSLIEIITNDSNKEARQTDPSGSGEGWGKDNVQENYCADALHVKPYAEPQPLPRDLNLGFAVSHLVTCKMFWFQKKQEEEFSRSLALQQQLEEERHRVALMKQQQAEQEQFHAFEEMIRRQELEKERLKILQQFGKPEPVPDLEGPLIPGVVRPPTDAKTPYHPVQPSSPGGGAVVPKPPVVDRSLKPGALGSPEGC